MANTVNNVAVGKPAVAGAVWVAPLGSTIPTNATTALASAYKCVGYISEDGATNSFDADTTEIKAWGGDTVYSGQNGKTVTWQMTMIEITNVDALKTVFGSDNVSGDKANGITVNINNSEPEEKIVVIDTILRDAIKRIVLPDAKVTEVGDITYTDDEVVGLETTFTAMPDASGNMQYEYIVATPTAGE